MGERLAVIKVRGRNSGRAISTPISVIRIGDSFTVICSRERTWWRNLRGGADSILRTRGSFFSVKGHVIESDTAVKAGLIDLFNHEPGLAQYFGIQKD